MLGLLGSIFGSRKAFSKTVDTIASTVDKFHYSDEERAQAIRQAQADTAKATADWLKATQGQNLARRVLALSITLTWLGAIVVAAVLSITGDLEAAAVVRQMVQELSLEVSLILTFYFAANKVGDVAVAMIERSKG